MLFNEGAQDRQYGLQFNKALTFVSMNCPRTALQELYTTWLVHGQGFSGGKVIKGRLDVIKLNCPHQNHHTSHSGVSSVESIATCKLVMEN